MATAVKVQPLTQRAAWKTLEAHYEKFRNVTSALAICRRS